MVAKRGTKPGHDDSEADAFGPDRPPFHPGSPEAQYLRNRSSYLAPGFAGKLLLGYRLAARPRLSTSVFIALFIAIVSMLLAMAYGAIFPQLYGALADHSPSLRRARLRVRAPAPAAGDIPGGRSQSPAWRCRQGLVSVLCVRVGPRRRELTWTWSVRGWAPRSRAARAGRHSRRWRRCVGRNGFVAAGQACRGRHGSGGAGRRSRRRGHRGQRDPAPAAHRTDEGSDARRRRRADGRVVAAVHHRPAARDHVCAGDSWSVPAPCSCCALAVLTATLNREPGLAAPGVLRGASRFRSPCCTPAADLTTWSLHPFYRERLCSAFALKRVALPDGAPPISADTSRRDRLGATTTAWCCCRAARRRASGRS